MSSDVAVFVCALIYGMGEALKGADESLVNFALKGYDKLGRFRQRAPAPLGKLLRAVRL